MDEGTEYVLWLRRQAGNFRAAADAAPDAKVRQAQQKLAKRLETAAAVLERALAAVTDGNGFQVARKLARGTRICVRFMNGETQEGLMLFLTKFDFGLLTDAGEELIIPKHGVQYWIVPRSETEETAAQEGEP